MFAFLNANYQIFFNKFNKKNTSYCILSSSPTFSLAPLSSFSSPCFPLPFFFSPASPSVTLLLLPYPPWGWRPRPWPKTHGPTIHGPTSPNPEIHGPHLVSALGRHGPTATLLCTEAFSVSNRPTGSLGNSWYRQDDRASLSRLRSPGIVCFHRVTH